MGYVSAKVVLISTGVLSMAMGLKLTLPLLSHFILTQGPHVWNFLLTCFTPPYLYILINFIILSIVASSKLNNHHHSPPDNTVLLYAAPPAALQIPAPDPLHISAAAQTDYSALSSDKYLYQTKPTPTYDSVGYVYEENTPVKATLSNDHGDESVGVLSPSLQRKDSSDFAFADENEKPPVSARFSHRKAVRASPEGGKVVALGVAKGKKQETLESTWKTITEGRAMPLKRHLKKAETWETNATPQQHQQGIPLRDLNGGDGGGGKVMKKSETFAGREKNTSTRLRKEPSLGQDELNRRVEAFINKFNAEMRLQRQESLRQYKNMVINNNRPTQ